MINRWLRITIFLGSIVFLLFDGGVWRQIAMAVDYYVIPCSQSHSDADCTCEQIGAGSGPCSYQKAVDCAVAGESIYRYGNQGEYDHSVECDDLGGGSCACDGTESNGLPIECDLNAGTATAPILHLSADGYDAVLDCESSTTGIVQAQNDHWFDKTEIKNASAIGLTIRKSRVTRSKVTNSGSYGVHLNNNGPAVIISTEVGAAGSYGIYFTNQPAEVEGCNIHDNANYGVYIAGWNMSVKRSILDTNAGGIRFNGTDSFVIDCTLYNNVTGITLSSGLCTVTNSIFESNSTAGITAPAGLSVLGQYNLFYNNGSNTGYEDLGTDVTGTATQFVDAAGGDFSLASTSVEALGAGMPVLCPSCTDNPGGDIGAVQDTCAGGAGAAFMPGFNSPAGGD